MSTSTYTYSASIAKGRALTIVESARIAAKAIERGEFDFAVSVLQGIEITSKNLREEQQWVRAFGQ